jgi:tripartite-type tricarboxylate transporter receptor subunit TctC
VKPDTRMPKSLAAVAAALWIAAMAPLLHAQGSEDAFYKGKTVRIIVGYGPGGGYDIYARMIAPYLAKTLGTTVVVENKPGAGGIAALNNLVVAPPDGLQTMHLNGTAAALSQLAGLSGVRYDIGEIAHLGTVGTSPFVWLVATNSKIKTPQDAINAHTRLTWAASGAIDVLSAGAAFTCDALALDCAIVLGYPGSNEAVLAVNRGEMDAMYVTDTSANNYVKAGGLRAVVTIGHKRSLFFPDTPTIFEALQLNPDQRWLFDYYTTLGNLGRILVAPPNLPATRLDFLQTAMKKALTDPVLVAEGERTQHQFDYLGAEPTRAAAKKVIESLSPEQRQRVRNILLKTQR